MSGQRHLEDLRAASSPKAPSPLLQQSHLHGPRHGGGMGKW